MSALLEYHITLLKQATKLIDTLTDEEFTVPEPKAYNSSIGAHLRHCLEHYQCLIDGWQQNRIDYASRKRDVTIETNRKTARNVVGSMIAFFAEVADSNLEERVEVLEEEDNKLTNSSLRRELQFLLSHTVHHYAMIGMMAEIRGIQTPDKFGIAPSTLRHHQRLEHR